jgi:hypothetical protein
MPTSRPAGHQVQSEQDEELQARQRGDHDGPQFSEAAAYADGGLLGLQRAIGNQAVGALLRREADSDAENLVPVAREMNVASGKIDPSEPNGVITDDEMALEQLMVVLAQTVLGPLSLAAEAAEAKPPKFDVAVNQTLMAQQGIFSYKVVAGEDADTQAAEETLGQTADVVAGYRNPNIGSSLVFDTIGLLEGLAIANPENKGDPGYMRRTAVSDLNGVLANLYIPLLTDDLARLNTNDAVMLARSAMLRAGMLVVEESSRASHALALMNMRSIISTAEAYFNQGAGIARLLRQTRDIVMDTAFPRKGAGAAANPNQDQAAPEAPRSGGGGGAGVLLPAIQKRSAGGRAAPAYDFGDRIRAALGGGSTLEDDTQQFLEQGLGADLSQVRIHTGAEANQLAEGVSAVAFTTGSDIFFRDGEFDTSTEAGLHLLAHEAAHTVQQAAGPVEGTEAPGGVAVSDPQDRFERAAEAAADAAVQNRPAEGTAQSNETQAQSAGVSHAPPATGG